MNNALRPLRKGGYSNQPQIVRFRASTGLYEALQRLAKVDGLCVAAVVRRLVVAGLEKTNDNQTEPQAHGQL
jgi:hypothetical protein